LETEAPAETAVPAGTAAAVSETPKSAGTDTGDKNGLLLIIVPAVIFLLLSRKRHRPSDDAP
jgi:hypothetical protein